MDNFKTSVKKKIYLLSVKNNIHLSSWKDVIFYMQSIHLHHLFPGSPCFSISKILVICHLMGWGGMIGWKPDYKLHEWFSKKMEGHDKNELTQLCVTIEQKNKLWYDIISYYILTSLLHYQNSCSLINYRQFDNIYYHFMLLHDL